MDLFFRDDRQTTVASDHSRCPIMCPDFNRQTPKKDEIPNQNYAMDVARTLQQTRWLLEVLGVWRTVTKNPKKWEIRVSVILTTLCSILLAFIMIPASLHMIFMDEEPMVRLILIGPVGFCMTNILKYRYIMLHRELIKTCIEHLEIDWMRIETDEDREIMIRNANVGRRLTGICAIFMYTGGLSFHTIVPLWRGTEVNKFNETVRPLVYPGWDIFVDSQKSPNYEMIFCTYCFCSCVMYTVTTVACNLAATLVAHTCGQVETMTLRLKNIFDRVDDTSETVKGRIDFVVKSHIRVLRLTSMVELLLREICLVEVVSSVIIICLLEYCLMKWQDTETVTLITYIALLVSVSFNMFIFCHIGELLKEQCFQIGNVAYMIDWYRLPGKTGRALILILAMANRPRKLTAGRMLELSVNSFGAIIRSSVAYLNMLRAMTD